MSARSAEDAAKRAATVFPLTRRTSEGAVFCDTLAAHGVLRRNVLAFRTRIPDYQSRTGFPA